MKANRIVFIVLPVAMMSAAMLAMTGIETRLAGLGNSEAARLSLGRVGIAAPYMLAAALGLIFLFGTAGSASIRAAGLGAAIGNSVVILVACLREGIRLAVLSPQVPAGRSALSYLDPSTMIGTAAALMSGCFAVRVAMVGNAAFARATPKRIVGKRALHGEADWMTLARAEKLFPRPAASSSVSGIASTVTVPVVFPSVQITVRRGVLEASRPCFVSTDRSAPRMVSSSQDRAVSKRLRSQSRLL